jgi:hypothetical protein
MVIKDRVQEDKGKVEKPCRVHIKKTLNRKQPKIKEGYT